MKPVNVLLLVLAGALGGAVIMKISQPPRRRTPIATVASKGDADKLPAPQLTDGNSAPAPIPQTVAPPLSDAAQVESVPAPKPESASARQPADDQAAPIESGLDDPSVRSRVKPRHSVVVRAEPPLTARMTPSPGMRRSSVLAPQTQSPAQLSMPASSPVASSTNQPALQVSQPAAAVEQPEPPTVPNPPPARREPEYSTPPSTPEPIIPTPHSVTLNAGFLIPVRLVDSLSSDRNQNGDHFAASLDHELVVDGFIIAERGARVEGQVVGVNKGTKTAGNAMLALEVTAIYTSDNQYVPVQTDAFNKHSEPDHRADAEKIGGGAAVGAIIGAMAAGGKGAAIGAGVGGGAGAGDVMLTRRPATLPSETRISFRMRAPVRITERLQ